MVFRKRLNWLIAVTLVAIVAMSLARLVATGTTEYFSTFTRADAILLGCLLALSGVRWPAPVAVAGLVALLAVTLLMPLADHDAAILLSMLAAAAVIGGEWRPLGRLAPMGIRAYSLYLWNWPMTLLFGSVAILAPLMDCCCRRGLVPPARGPRARTPSATGRRRCPRSRLPTPRRSRRPPPRDAAASSSLFPDSPTAGFGCS